MLESMWSSMSSSMQLAQECLEKNEDEEAAAAATSNMEGLEKFAQTIDNSKRNGESLKTLLHRRFLLFFKVLNRIKAKFVNTEVRFEYLPKGSDVGVALIIKLKRLIKLLIGFTNKTYNFAISDSFEYQNEASSDASTDKDEGDEKTILLATHDTHHITLEDITFYTEEFRIGEPKTKTPSENLDDTFSSTLTSDPYMSALSSDNEMFYSETIKSRESESEESEDEADNIYRSEMVMIGRVMNRQELRINMKLADNIDGPKVSLHMSIGAIAFFLTPRQMHMLILLCDILINGEVDDVKEMSPPPRNDDKRNYVSSGKENLENC
jgi:autophagy-related protein 2